MASKTVVELVDDLDGSLANETVSFAHDGVEYAIDLSEENAARLRSVLAEFIGSARRVTGRTRRATVAENSPAVSTVVEDIRVEDIRVEDTRVEDTRAEITRREAARRARSSVESRRGNGARVDGRGNGTRGGDVAAAELTAEIRRLARKTANAVSAAAQPNSVEANVVEPNDFGTLLPPAAPTPAGTAQPASSRSPALAAGHFSAATQDSADQADAGQTRRASVGDAGKVTALLIPFKEAGF